MGIHLVCVRMARFFGEAALFFVVSMGNQKESRRQTPALRKLTCTSRFAQGISVFKRRFCAGSRPS